MRNDNLIDRIRAASAKCEFPDGAGYVGLSAEKTLLLAGELNVSPRRIEIEALENNIFPNRYIRNFRAFSPDDQLKLLKSSASVIGLGGLGGGVVEILARIGVGRLVLIDGDVFEDSNLNRQLYSSYEKLGRSKAEAAAKRVREINRSVQVNVFKQYLEAQNAEILIGETDVIVDCLDSVATRFVVQTAARKMKKPMVSAAVAGASGQLTTIFPEDEGFRLIYGDPTEIIANGAEQSLGCLPQAVAFFSSMECSEVVKILLGRGNILRNSLLLADLDFNTFDLVRLI